MGAAAEGEGELEVGLVCTQAFDVWRRIGDDSRSRVTDTASVWQQWVPAPHAALGQRVELALPADGPYSYEGDCVSLRWAVVVRRVGEKRVARARARVGGAMRLRVEVEGEPLAPGAAVSGRVIVEDGGRARSLSVRLAFVERTADFEKVARDAGTQVLAEGDLADGTVVAFRLALPRTPCRRSPRRTLASAGRSAPASIAPVRTPPPTGRSNCSRVTLPPTGRGGRVAEGTRLLSEYGDQTPSRVRIPPSPSARPIRRPLARLEPRRNAALRP